MKLYILINIISFFLALGSIFIIYSSYPNSEAIKGYSVDYIFNLEDKILYFEDNKFYIVLDGDRFILNSENFTGDIEDVRMLFNITVQNGRDYVVNNDCKYIKLSSSQQYYFDSVICLYEI